MEVHMRLVLTGLALCLPALGFMLCVLIFNIHAVIEIVLMLSVLGFCLACGYYMVMGIEMVYNYVKKVL